MTPWMLLVKAIKTMVLGTLHYIDVQVYGRDGRLSHQI